MSEKVFVAKDSVVALFHACGFKMAHKWDPSRLAKKLRSISEIVDDSVVLSDEVEATLITIQEAFQNGQEVEVGELEETAPVEEEEAVEEGEVVEEEVAEQDGADDADQRAVEDEPVVEEPAKVEKAEKSAEKSAGKKPAKRTAKDDKVEKAVSAIPKSESGPDLGPTPGVRSMRNRRFVAGIVIREKGLEAGITDEMIKLVDEQYGSPNPNVSKKTLVDGWHVINGYVNG